MILNILIMHYTYCGQIDNSIYDIILKYIMALGVGRTKSPENKSNGKKAQEYKCEHMHTLLLISN